MATRDVGRIVAEREQRERIGDRNVGESGESESGDGEAGRLQDTPSGTHKKLRLAVRGVIGGVLFLAVLACATFSKLTLVGLTNQLRELTVELTVNGTHLEVRKYLRCSEKTIGLYYLCKPFYTGLLEIVHGVHYCRSIFHMFT